MKLIGLTKCEKNYPGELPHWRITLGNWQTVVYKENGRIKNHHNSESQKNLRECLEYFKHHVSWQANLSS
jgi:hypothetical protein